MIGGWDHAEYAYRTGCVAAKRGHRFGCACSGFDLPALDWVRLAYWHGYSEVRARAAWQHNGYCNTGREFGMVTR